MQLVPLHPGQPGSIVTGLFTPCRCANWHFRTQINQSSSAKTDYFLQHHHTHTVNHHPRCHHSFSNMRSKRYFGVAVVPFGLSDCEEVFILVVLSTDLSLASSIECETVKLSTLFSIKHPRKGVRSPITYSLTKPDCSSMSDNYDKLSFQYRFNLKDINAGAHTWQDLWRQSWLMHVYSIRRI